MRWCLLLLAALSMGPTVATSARDEPLRPRIHFTPPTNFMNDPNGLVFFDGEYHLFYQHNPFGDRWGHMSWGHAISRDLLHWQDLPVALREEDGIMIFSGSAVVDRRDSSGLCGGQACLVAIYTGHTPTRQTQNLAYSTDRGRTWRKFAGNPVIDLGLKDFRDPKVFWHAPTSRWVMVTVLPDQHKVRFFGSTDLKKWEVLSDFGPAGATGGVWECPDLFELPIEGGRDTRWVLDVDLNPGGVAGGSGGQYFVGHFDGRTFTPDEASPATRWADHGKDFYATISYADVPPADGRRIWMAWMSNWLYANDEPSQGWRGALSIPRALSLRRAPDGLRLVQTPIGELDTLRVAAAPSGIAGAVPLPEAADVRFGVWASRSPAEAGVRLFNDAGEELRLGIDGDRLFVDRTRSRATPFHEAYPGRRSAALRALAGKHPLRVIVDRTTVEVFGADGETVISERVWPTRPFTHVEPIGAARFSDPPRMWALRSVWGASPASR